MPSGSAYLEGATVTVAGATLLQRVAGAVAKFGGNVLSTQLDLQGAPPEPVFSSMIASCEIEQPQLQQLLYDIEAGMPFLFVDQLVVQTPLTASGSGKRQVAGPARGVRTMARCQMRRSFTIGLTVLALSVHDVRVGRRGPAMRWMPASPTDVAASAGRRRRRPWPAEPVTTVRVVAPPAAPVRTPAAANPAVGAFPLTSII